MFWTCWSGFVTLNISVIRIKFYLFYSIAIHNYSLFLRYEFVNMYKLENLRTDIFLANYYRYVNKLSRYYSSHACIHTNKVETAICDIVTKSEWDWIDLSWNVQHYYIFIVTILTQPLVKNNRQLKAWLKHRFTTANAF